MTELRNILLIAGGGRNVGKTHLGCHVISTLAQQGILPVAIKVSGHFHQPGVNIKSIVKDEGLFIGEELNINSNKDSSRFLQAGAKRSYYVQLSQNHLIRLVEFIKNSFSGDQPIIFESAGLGELVKPGIAFFVIKNNIEKKCSWKFKYFKINGFEPDNIPEWPVVKWINSGWLIESGSQMQYSYQTNYF